MNCVIADNSKLRVLVRDPAKLHIPENSHHLVEVVKGSITDGEGTYDMDKLVSGADYVVFMVGDRAVQAEKMICYPFMKDKLVPAMRRHRVKRLLYQAGGFTRPHDGDLSWIIWALRSTIASSFEGQHKDNDAVHKWLYKEASDIEWMGHRAGIGGDGPTKGVLQRAPKGARPSIASHIDCAEYSYRLVRDASAIHTTDFSRYVA